MQPGGSGPHVKKSKQEEMLEKLQRLNYRKNLFPIMDLFGNFQESVQASEPEMSDSDSNRIVELVNALHQRCLYYQSDPDFEFETAIEDVKRLIEEMETEDG
jgi:hypothetical protein